MSNTRINHQNLDQVNAFTQTIKQDSTASRTTDVIESAWPISDGWKQYQSKLVFDKGIRGVNTTPSDSVEDITNCADPMHYFYYGLASDYTGVFASLAASLGVNLKCLVTRVEADMNLSQAEEASPERILECVRIELKIVSDAEISRIRQVEALAQKQCPVGFLCSHQIMMLPECGA